MVRPQRLTAQMWVAHGLVHEMSNRGPQRRERPCLEGSPSIPSSRAIFRRNNIVHKSWKGDAHLSIKICLINEKTAAANKQQIMTIQAATCHGPPSGSCIATHSVSKITAFKVQKSFPTVPILYCMVYSTVEYIIFSNLCFRTKILYNLLSWLPSENDWFHCRVDFHAEFEVVHAAVPRRD